MEQFEVMLNMEDRRDAMKTLFDLRVKQTEEMVEAVKSIFEEPLKIVRLEDPITPCIGCWNCWLKTPGICVMKDQMTTSYSDYVNSDTVILLLDTAQGFINHQGKVFLDRTIPHYHPYIDLVQGECHHVARYERYPDMVFHYDLEGLTDQEETVIEDYLVRMAFHFKSKAFRLVGNGSLQLQPLKNRKANNHAIAFGSTDPMDRLVIYNGSPRRSGSNSALILEEVQKVLGDRVEMRDLKQEDQWEQWAEAFTGEKNVMFFMPLYVHAMPSHVMGFMEKLQASAGGISFFMQSGFPESSQSHYLEAYFEQLSIRLGRTYLGTAIKGGMESLQMRPEKARTSMMEPLVKAIETLVLKGEFSTSDIHQLARPVRFGAGVQMLFKLVGKKFINSFWDQKLKANGAYEKRFERPYRA